MSRLRVPDWAFFAYFVSQIPGTLIFDSQGVYPECLYPGFAKSLRSMYLNNFRDPFLADAWKHPWYLSICLVEHFIEMPFFCWAAYVYYKHGAKKEPRIIIPSILYGVHTMTGVLGIWFMALGADFSQSDALAPRTLGERIHLCSAYSLFFVVSAWIVVDHVMLLWPKVKDKIE